jgi:hypothetical protein
MSTCTSLQYTAAPCPEKPAAGIRHCHRHTLTTAGSSRKRGPRPGHCHGPSCASNAAPAAEVTAMVSH